MTWTRTIATKGDEWFLHYSGVMSSEPEQRPNSRKGIPNGKAKAYGDRDQRFGIAAEPEDVLGRLMAADPVE